MEYADVSLVTPEKGMSMGILRYTMHTVIFISLYILMGAVDYGRTGLGLGSGLCLGFGLGSTEVNLYVNLQ